MDNRIYLSVLTVPSSAGDIGFTLATTGASSDITVVGLVTGVSTSDTEKSLAEKIYEQINIIVAQNSATYSPPAQSLTDTKVASFQITKTDHVICFWSQSSFSLSITSNPTGAILTTRSNPTLITVTDARLYGAVMGQAFSGLSDTQVALLMGMISDELISVLRNRIVASTYLLDTWTSNFDGFRLPAYPVISASTPYIVDPWTIWCITTTGFINILYCFLIQKDGWIMYRWAQGLLFDSADPFAMGNEFRITWIAGYDRIPESVKLALISLSPYYTTSGIGIYEELKGGTSSVKYRDSTKEKNSIFSNLNEFFL